MLEFMAKKPCRFQGKNYKVGDKILETLINRKAIGALIAMDIITKVKTSPLPPTPAYNKPPVKAETPVSTQTPTQEEISKAEGIDPTKKNKKKPLKVVEENEP